ncbi:unnamed protein product [Discula destructiva]
MDAAKLQAQTNAIKAIQDNPVAMFSKDYCPYCKDVKIRLAEFLGGDPHAKPKNPVFPETLNHFAQELNQMEDGAVFQEVFNDRTYFGKEEVAKHGLEYTQLQRSVPNIWIGKKQIGGCDDFMEINDEKLKEMLEAAGAKLL